MTQKKGPWNPFTLAVDKATVNGVPTPGICEVTGASSPRKWDEREGYALSGAFLVFHGRGVARFDLVLSLYTVEDWNDWTRFAPIVMRVPTSMRPRALDITHPVLEAVKIRAAVIEEVIAPVQTEDGVWTITIKCLEWRTPAAALARPEGSEATPTDPFETEYIKPLIDQVSSLSARTRELEAGGG